MRKGQSGINAAILIAIILGLIVLYVVYLPTSEREKLLLNKTTSSGNGGGEEDEDVLLLEFPKSLDKVSSIDEKDLPNVYLFKSTQAKEIETINPLVVRNGVFDKKDKTATFSIDNVENVDKILLSFAAKIAKAF